nr:LamG domain-containing protein [Halovibrio salipaludis]
MPDNVSEITVELWGGGGRGGSRESPGAGGGGGGGGYVSQTFQVSPEEVYEYQIGAGSINGEPGESSYLSGPAGDVEAFGGESVSVDEDDGAVGGAGVGTAVYQGGTGGTGETDGLFGTDRQAGGGGASAGPAGNGADGQTPEGGDADQDSGIGGDGAETEAWDSQPGNPGEPPGGGGGGATTCFRWFCPAEEGGAGGDGQIRITTDGDPLKAPVDIAYWFDGDWDGATSVPDQSGNGNTGVSNGAAFVGAGDDGAIPNSPGTCGFASIPADGNITSNSDVANDNDSFSMGFWVRMEQSRQASDTPSIVAVGDVADFYAQRAEVLADFREGRRDLVFAVRTRQGQGQGQGSIRQRELRWTPDAGTETDPFSGNWVHIAVSHDLEAHELVMYVNGNAEIIRDDYRGGRSVVEAGSGIQIGGFSDGTAPAAFDFDEFRYSGNAISSSQAVRLANQSRPCNTGLAGFEINASSIASVCQALPVQVTAINAAGAKVADYTGAVDLSTSSGNGNWSIAEDGGEGGMTPSPDMDNNGAAQYQFVEADEGQVTLALSNELADQLTVSVVDNEAQVSATSDPIQFQENIFQIQSTDPLGVDFVAGRDHRVQIAAFGRGQDQECGPITAYDGAVALKAWLDRSGQDPGGKAPSLNGSNALPDSEPASGNVDVVFSEGVAELPWQTTDVAQYSLNVLDDSSGIVQDEEGNPLPVSGQGPEWTVRPFAFDVSVPDNPGASSPTGDPFQAAGRPFDVRVRAVQWQAADDGNDDGQPDGHGTADPANRAGLSDNAATVSFGASSPVAELSSTLVAGPPDPADPGLPGTPEAEAFTDGQDTVTTRFDEAGSIAVQASLDGGYLGRPVTVRGRSGFVGRFHPELFTVEPADGAFEPTCNDFAYTGQAYSYDPAQAPELTITPKAYRASGTAPQVTNYREAWQLLEAAEVSRNFPAEDNSNGLDVSVDQAAEGDLAPLEDGKMLYQFAGDEFIYTRTGEAQVDAFPSDLTLEVTDIDDGDAQLAGSQSPVTLQPSGVEIRYGRVSLGNVYGPAGVDLVMPLRVEYWDGERFTLNTADESGVPPTESGEGCFQYSPWNDEDGGDVQIASPDVADNARSGDTAAEAYGLSEGQPKSGNEVLLRSARDPVDTDDRQSEVELLNVPDWLKPFDSDGNLQNPSATATFGIYRGHDRIIYWREVQ